jgi:mitochondrial enoyl-[acyl-carrier protein] reductase / trans-2-enoyl-CoA reductase
MALAVRIHAHGDPATVLRFEDLPEAVPGTGQIQVRMRLAPVNPADINVIEGSYGRLPTLPATLGNEGVGMVEAIGSGVEGLQVGDLVRPRDGVGSWCRRLIADAVRCTRLPAGLPDEQAAQLAINPGTAWAVLHSFGPVPPGGWVLLNAPASGVGRSLIALARSRGLRVAAIVRRPDEVPEGVVAIPEGKEAAKQVRAATGGTAMLALNQVGGDSAVSLAKALAPLASLVTIGALAKQPLGLPNGAVIFGELRCCGFWVSRWFERADAATVTVMLEEMAGLLRSGALLLPVAATYPLERAGEAIAHARQGGRGGKILLDCA